MRILWTRLSVLTVVLAAATTASALPPGLHTNQTLSWQGIPRVYDVQIPACYDAGADLPLVVDIHGWSRTSAFQRDHSGFAAVAETGCFIVAWPQGFSDPISGAPPSWEAGSLHCNSNLGLLVIDDVGFIRAMVAAIGAQNRVDPRRIYATGNSCGGAMTHRLACEAVDLFAAFAPFSWDVAMISSCTPSRGVPLLTTHSYDDIRIFYPPGHSPDDNPNLPVLPGAQAGLEEWRTRNACVGASPDVTEQLGPTSICELYTNCRDGVQVGLCSVHTDPTNLFGHYPYPPLVLDGSNTSQRAWGFLSSFSLPAPVPALSPFGEILLVGLVAAAIATALRRRAS